VRFARVAARNALPGFLNSGDLPISGRERRNSHFLGTGRMEMRYNVRRFTVDDVLLGSFGESFQGVNVGFME